MLPVWVAILSESNARIRWAAKHAERLSAEDREWAEAAAVGTSDWATRVLLHFPALCLTTWFCLLAAAVAATPHGGASG